MKKREREQQQSSHDGQSDDRDQKPKSQDDKKDEPSQEDNNDEHDWRRSRGKDTGKHNPAYGKSGDQDADSNGQAEHKAKTEYQKLREKYSPQEIILLRHLQHEKAVVESLQLNDGKQKSPAFEPNGAQQISIEAVDGMTPDNWVPRSGNLVRNTGQHPMNAEPRLEALFKAGLITPNHLHYVRNHGAVPRLFWDTHVLDVCDGALKLSMDDIRDNFDPISIPIALACDGNRRGEMNKIKKSKGFSWGAGAVSCAFWKGVLLRQVLEKAYPNPKLNDPTTRRWVNFEGADEPSEGKYATCMPLEYALDPTNDVLLAYEMNDAILPPDHGYPLRLIIPGWVGGRCIKWLNRIWISDKENDSHYHIWDNRVLPEFITEKDGDFARTMFHHPSTLCNEQNLNSVIVHPAQGQEMKIADVLKQDTFRVEGYAYDGGGHEVQRVELSLDGGHTWLYCLRKFPDNPLRHGNKFWTWVHWHIDLDATHFVRAESLRVRCFNVFKNTQPEKPVWNTMGMMNNGWYTIKIDTSSNGQLTFRHPVHQEDDGGWMKPSVEDQLSAAQQTSNVPDKQFTRQEIEKHNKAGDCWIVINGNVYDATSVLSWHPGGSATILANAAKLSLQVTSSFESIHDEYAQKKLDEHIIGRVTDKAKTYMQEQAKAEAEAAAKGGSSNLFLKTQKWRPVKLTNKKQLSTDTFTYTFQYQGDKGTLGLGTCQHIQFGIHMLDKMLIRSYTPTRPITQSDDDGTFDLTVKTYFPDENQPGGAFSTFLHELPVGYTVDVCGPTGEIEYLGNSTFKIEGEEKRFSKINLVLGGSGVTPGFSLIERIRLEEKENKKKKQNNKNGDNSPPQVRIIDANKTEDDILLHSQLDEAEADSPDGGIKITHVLSHPKDKDSWIKKGGLTGHVNDEIIRKSLFEPAEDAVVFLCGPPGLIQKAVIPAVTSKCI